MAKPFIPEQLPGKISVVVISNGCHQVFFTPPRQKLEEANLDPTKELEYRRCILEVNNQDNYIIIFPLNTLSTHEDFLKSKYTDFNSITLKGFDYGSVETEEDVENLLEGLPSSFVKDYNYGLGIRKEYQVLIHKLIDWGITDLVISEDFCCCEGKATLSGDAKVLTLKYSVFDTLRRNLDRIIRKARESSLKVRSTIVQNSLSYFLDDERYPQIELKVQDSTLEKLITKSTAGVSSNLSKYDQKAAIELISKNKKVISQENSERLIKLHNEIEIVALENLIKKYEEALSKKNKEIFWQELFKQNPFILSLSLGYPLIKIQDEAFVGGTKVSGEGGKYSDYLMRNKLTNNTAIIEIKTPQTKLFNDSSYRKGVFTPSSEFSGSINQILDQCYHLQTNIAHIKHFDSQSSIEAYSVHGVLIIGKTPKEDDKQRSFELFRGNSKNITIITFDEMLEKLRQLYNFLTPPV